MSLLAVIKSRIASDGPITVAEYMELALTHLEFGYYMRRDPLGTQGDFTTSPEISQIFGELIGLWIAEQWRIMGKPKAVLAELGPGRGTLMSDILRATKYISGFHDAIDIRLIEMSPALKHKQFSALAGKHPRIEWQEQLDLPPLPLLLVANEFFDALPVRQFMYNGVWKERMVDVSEKGALFFTVIPAKAGIQLPIKIDPRVKPEDDNIMYEQCPAALDITRTITRHIKAHGGTALIIDYGYEGGSRGDTLQAVKAHSYYDPLNEPGMADLTTHVDFDALKNIATSEGAAVYGVQPQGAFLGKLGAIARALKLCETIPDDGQSTIMAGLTRLVSPDQMGDLFKMLCIASPNHPKPEGF